LFLDLPFTTRVYFVNLLFCLYLAVAFFVHLYFAAHGALPNEVRKKINIVFLKNFDFVISFYFRVSDCARWYVVNVTNEIRKKITIVSK